MCKKSGLLYCTKVLINLPVLPSSSQIWCLTVGSKVVQGSNAMYIWPTNNFRIKWILQDEYHISSNKRRVSNKSLNPNKLSL